MGIKIKTPSQLAREQAHAERVQKQKESQESWRNTRLDLMRSDRSYTVREAMVHLGVGYARMMQYLREGRFKRAFKRGSMWFIPIADVEKFKRITENGRPVKYTPEQIARREEKERRKIITRLSNKGKKPCYTTKLLPGAYIPERLRACRKELGLNMKELGDTMEPKVNQMVISRWETKGPIEFDNLKRMAARYEVHVSYFLHDAFKLSEDGNSIRDERPEGDDGTDAVEGKRKRGRPRRRRSSESLSIPEPEQPDRGSRPA